MTDENWREIRSMALVGHPRKGQRIQIKMVDGQVIDGVVPLVKYVPFVPDTFQADFNWRDMKGNRIDKSKVAAWRPR